MPRCVSAAVRELSQLLPDGFKTLGAYVAVLKNHYRLPPLPLHGPRSFEFLAFAKLVTCFSLKHRRAVGKVRMWLLCHVRGNAWLCRLPSKLGPHLQSSLAAPALPRRVHDEIRGGCPASARIQVLVRPLVQVPDRQTPGVLRSCWKICLEALGEALKLWAGYRRFDGDAAVLLEDTQTQTGKNEVERRRRFLLVTGAVSYHKPSHQLRLRHQGLGRRS